MADENIIARADPDTLDPARPLTIEAAFERVRGYERDMRSVSDADHVRDLWWALTTVDRLKLDLAALRAACETVLAHPNPGDLAKLRELLDELAEEPLG
jgi:hypothetical protein